MADDIETALLTGIAEALATAGVGSWSAAGALGAEPAIVLRYMPSTPERVICLTEYGATASARLTDATLSLNVRARGTRDPSVVSAVRANVYATLHACGRRAFGSVLVNDVQFQSEAILGPDAGGRHERSINFTVLYNRAHAALD